MSKTLTEQDIIRIMREEWDKRVSALSERVDIVLSTDVPTGDDPSSEEEKIIISPELKVFHKVSGIRYTVDSVGSRNVILLTPEGEKFIVDKDTFEDEYCLKRNSDAQKKSG